MKISAIEPGARVGLLLVLLAPALGAAPARADAPGWTIGPFGGFAAPDEELAGPDGPSTAPALGLRAAGPFGPRFGWACDALWTEIETETFAGDAVQLAGRAAVEAVLTPARDDVWIVSLGGGYTRITFDAAENFWSYTASAGLGQRILAGARAWIRWELRVDRTLADDGLRGEDLTTAQFLIGLDWGRRVRAERPPAAGRRDADGDGIADSLDRCPGTPRGRAVDAEGCEPDGDRDGVPDSRDDCRATAAGLPVDERGCVLDSDGDGVPDDRDRCPRTMRGIQVGADGCFVDEDRDGVYDGLDMDKCPGTPAGAVVDAHGCPLDGDGDGVWDGLDRCPGSAEGAKVGPDGCP